MALCSGRGSCLGHPSCSYESSSFFRSAATRHYSQRSLCRQQTCIFVLECQFNPSKILCLRDGVTKKENSATRLKRRSYLTRTQRHTSSSPTRYRRNGDSDVSEDNNVWDSNAENIWRRRSYGKGFFSPQSDKSSNPPPGWKQPRKEWDYDSKDKTSDSRWQWWQFAKDNDEYDYESGEEEEEEEEDNESDFDFKSILQEQVFSLLRLGFPLIILVLPWLLGNPVILMIGLTAIPAVQKAVGPVLSQVWRAFLDFAGYPVPPKRRQKPPSSRQMGGFEERGGETFSGWSSGVDYTQPYRYTRQRPGMDGNSGAQEDGYREDVRYREEDVAYQDLDADSDRFSQDPRASRPVATVGDLGSRVNEVGRAGEMRGWDELTVDRRRRMSTQRRPGKPGRLVRKRARKEKPLLVRLILALFPFLQDWGGWLSVLLFLPLLDSFWAVVAA